MIKKESPDDKLHMFFCSWCKNKFNDVFEYAQDGENLCSICSEKYNFGLSHGLIAGKVSQLSSEERKMVSLKLRDAKSFNKTTRSIKKTVIKGKPKSFLTFFGWILTATPFILSVIFFPETEFSFLLSLLILSIISLFLYKIVEWFLKFLQFKKFLP